MFLPLFVISVNICVDDDIGMAVADIDDFGVAAADSFDDIGMSPVDSTDDIGVVVAGIDDIGVIDLDVGDTDFDEGIGIDENGWLIVGSVLLPNQEG